MWLTFCSKNTTVYENTFATTVNGFVIYELMMFWTTGPWMVTFFEKVFPIFRFIYLFIFLVELFAQWAIYRVSTDTR